MNEETLQPHAELKVFTLSPLAFPDNFDQIPSGEALIDRFKYYLDINQEPINREKQKKLEILKEQAKLFQTSEHIIVNLGNFGLGDAIIQLAFANALAREFQNKRITVLIHSSIQQMKTLHLEPNIHLKTTIDDAIQEVTAHPSSSLIIQLLRGPKEIKNTQVQNPETYVVPRNENTDIDTKRKIDLFLSKLIAEHRWLIPLDTRLDEENPLPYHLLLMCLEKEYEIQNYSSLDLNFLLTLKLLGARIEKRHVMYPILDKRKILDERNKHISGLLNKNKRFEFDVMIAFDAGEYSVQLEHESVIRSLKSPSLADVENMCQQLIEKHPNIKIGIIPGKQHKEYSNKIFEIIQKYFPNTRECITPSFDDMIGYFAASRVILTADSVTRWLAEALLRTAQHFDNRKESFMPEQYLLTLHNGARIPYSEYGPRNIQNCVCLGSMPFNTDDEGRFAIPIKIPGSKIADELSNILASHFKNNELRP